MERHSIEPRQNWQTEVERLGLVWHTAGDRPYWDESAYYSFDQREIDEIEAAASRLYEMFIEAGQWAIDNKSLDLFAIPTHAQDAVVAAWQGEPPALNYGRFDFGYDGKGPPKLFEFNCDTPTSLLEAAVVQWAWKEQVFPNLDQFTSLHAKLVAKWQELRPLLSKTVHFTHVDDEAGEDTVTVSYMRDAAETAGVHTKGVVINDVGWDGHRFVDLDEEPISTLFHLYPWEWLANEEFGPQLVKSLDQTLWIEPIWKMLWSNKAILPILWQLFPNHENLLEADFNPIAGGYARKPILAREGANVEIVENRQRLAKTGGDYGEEGYVYQGLYPLAGEGERRPVIGAWVVDGAPAGLGIREDGLITGNTARFIPHVIEA